MWTMKSKQSLRTLLPVAGKCYKSCPGLFPCDFEKFYLMNLMNDMLIIIYLLTFEDEDSLVSIISLLKFWRRKEGLIREEGQIALLQ